MDTDRFGFEEEVVKGEVFFNCEVYELCGAMDSLLDAILYGEELIEEGIIDEWGIWDLGSGKLGYKLADGSA